MITIKGCNEIRDYIGSYFNYLGIGNNNAAVAETQNTLYGELIRKVSGSSEANLDKKVTKEYVLGAGDANGEFIKEIGIFKTPQFTLEDFEDVSDWTTVGDGVLTSSTTYTKIGDYSGKMALTYSTGLASTSKVAVVGDMTDYTKTLQGTPAEGWISMWIYTPDVTKLNPTDAIIFRIGSSASNYAQYKLQASSLTDNLWYYWKIAMSSAEIVGNPDWSNVTYQEITIKETASTEVYFDELMYSGRMLSRSVIPTIEKTSNKEIVFEIDITVDNQ